MRGNPSEKEARLFCRYLIKKTPSDFATILYSKAIEDNSIEVNDTDRKILQFAIDHPWSLRLLDSGAAIAMPQSELRRRLYTMFAILESTPEYADSFLTVDRSVFYLATIFFSGLRALLFALGGIILIKIIA